MEHVYIFLAIIIITMAIFTEDTQKALAYNLFFYTAKSLMQETSLIQSYFYYLITKIVSFYSIMNVKKKN